MSFLKEFIDFRILITTYVIKVVYVLGLLIITLAGFVSFLAGITKTEVYFFPKGVWGVIWGVFAIIFVNIIWRLFCEWLIIMFNIQDILVSVEKELKK